jgi:hypothetical protein
MHLPGLWRMSVATVCTAALLGGCGRSDQVKSLAHDMLKAGAGTAAPPMRTVVPSKPPVEMQSLRIEEERYLGEIARYMGTTVEAIRALNRLGEQPLTTGMVLQIETSREAVERYCTLRAQRKADKLAQAEAKLQAKLRAEAEARAAKRAKQLAARARKRGQPLPQGVAAEQLPGMPLRPGETRVVGSGQVRGVMLPQSVGR